MWILIVVVVALILFFVYVFTDSDKDLGKQSEPADTLNAKKEIKIKKNNLRAVLYIIFIPLLLMLFIEHFGDFKFNGYGGVPVEQFKANNVIFKTPFGNVVNVDVSGKRVGYDRLDNGTYKILSKYYERFPYYLRGIMADIIYPSVIIVGGLLICFFRNKYSIRIS